MTTPKVMNVVIIREGIRRKGTKRPASTEKGKKKVVEEKAAKSEEN